MHPLELQDSLKPVLREMERLKMKQEKSVKKMKLTPGGKEYPYPTIDQALEAWALLNDLLEIGYPHNFQHEAPHIRSYMFKIAGIVDKAYKIKRGSKKDHETL